MFFGGHSVQNNFNHTCGFGSRQICVHNFIARSDILAEAMQQVQFGTITCYLFSVTLTHHCCGVEQYKH